MSLSYIIQVYIVGAPQCTQEDFVDLMAKAKCAKPKCFSCDCHLDWCKGADSRVRLSVDRTNFKDRKALGHTDERQVVDINC
ncbi:hypothetical protein BGX26_006098, partial [Mortierella sp. AD094]